MRFLHLVLILIFTNVRAGENDRYLSLPNPEKCKTRFKEFQYDDRNYFYSGHDKELKDAKLDWLDSRNTCRERCMETVSFETQAEFDFIKEYIMKNEIKFVWTSGRLCDFAGCEGRWDLLPKIIKGWLWSANQKQIDPTNKIPNGWTYTPWSNTGHLKRKQPDNAEFFINQATESCLGVLNNQYNDSVTWHDIACYHKTGFICEDSAELLSEAQEIKSGSDRNEEITVEAPKKIETTPIETTTPRERPTRTTANVKTTTVKQATTRKENLTTIKDTTDVIPITVTSRFRSPRVKSTTVEEITSTTTTRRPRTTTTNEEETAIPTSSSTTETISVTQFNEEPTIIVSQEETAEKIVDKESEIIAKSEQEVTPVFVSVPEETTSTSQPPIAPRRKAYFKPRKPVEFSSSEQKTVEISSTTVGSVNLPRKLFFKRRKLVEESQPEQVHISETPKTLEPVSGARKLFLKRKKLNEEPLQVEQGSEQKSTTEEQISSTKKIVLKRKKILAKLKTTLATTEESAEIPSTSESIIPEEKVKISSQTSNEEQVDLQKIDTPTSETILETKEDTTELARAIPIKRKQVKLYRKVINLKTTTESVIYDGPSQSIDENDSSGEYATTSISQFLLARRKIFKPKFTPSRYKFLNSQKD